MPFRLRSLHFVFFSLLTLCATAHAGPVNGRVVDPGGGAIAGAHVLLVSGGTVIRTAVTNGRGEFQFKAPDAGEYDLRVAVDGFRAAAIPLRGTPEAHDAGTLTLDVSAVAESVVVSAAQVEIPLSQAASSLTVITGADLEARQIHTVADALRSVPGMTVVATGGVGSVTTVFPRGGESDYSMVLIDGVEANSFGGMYDFAHLSTANVERIEVVRGPQSALFGSNAIGGVVRIVTKHGGPPAGSATIEGGSFDTSRLAAGFSGSHLNWEWGVSAERLSSGGMNGHRSAAGALIGNDDYTRNLGSAGGGWRDAGGRFVRGDVRFANDERGFPGPYGTNPIGAFPGIDTVSRGTDDRWLASVASALPVGQRARMQGQVTYGRIGGAYIDPYGQSETSSRRMTARWQTDASLGAAFSVSGGVEFEREQAESTFITGAAFERVPVTRQVIGYFGEGRWHAADRLFVTAGLRVDDIRRDQLEADPNAYAPRPEFATDTVVSTNPKVAVVWFARPASGSFTRLRAAAGTGIRPPDAFEIAFTDNPSLKPERSRSAEFGIDQAMAGAHGLIEATAFFNNYDDLIVAVGSFQQSSRYRTDNIANARARGLELAGTARSRLSAARQLDLEFRVSYTLLDTQVLALDQTSQAPPPFTVGDPLLRRPRNQFSTDLVLTTSRLSAFVHGGGRGRALDVEPSTGTYGGLFYAPGFSVWNAGASWQVVRGIDAFARVENLLDTQYEEALGYPAAGRGVMVGLRIAASR